MFNVEILRMVLLKKFGAEGFTFYTNYTSRKAAELEENPRYFAFSSSRGSAREGRCTTEKSLYGK